MDEFNQTGAADTSNVTSGDQSVSTPTPVELKDDSFVKLPGSDKPVKYGEWFRGFQAKHTEATTQRAQLQRQIEQFKADRAQEQAELNRYRAASQQTQAPPQQKFDLPDRFKDLAYLKGPEAAEMAQSLYGEIQKRDQALNVRDTAIRILANKVAQMDQMVNQFGQRFSSTDFSSKIERFRNQLNIPEEGREWLEELYSAYEGEDLDQEFPKIAQQRWEQLQSITRAIDRKKVDDARKARFVPGKGGVGSPSKPLSFTKESPKEIADQLWGMLQGEEAT